ncbi:MAG: NAD(P)-dependent alcohol dehydrogenase [Egibacteraceae bacterium]
MKAVRVHEYDPTYTKRPSVDEVPEPEITGPLDVIVKIGGAGLCRTDLHIMEGQWAPKTGVQLPYVIGHENAGWVHAVGDGVPNLAVGDTVICHPLMTCGLCRQCRAGDDMHCIQGAFPGIDRDGGMAELLKTNARACVKLDPSLEPADVAALADAGLTAYHAVKKASALLYPGTKTVIMGAGGLGHIGVQCLDAMTATTIIVVDRNPDALKLTTDWGADHTIVADGNEVAAVMELTDGQGADVVIDFVGEKGAQQASWEMTRRAGSHFVIGYGDNVDVPTIDIISTERNVVGNLVGTFNDLAELMVLAAQGLVTLKTAVYPLDTVNDAISDLDAGRLRGRGILVP